MGVLTPVSPTIYSMTRQFAAANATKEAAGRIFSRRPRAFDKLYHAAASVRLDFQKRTMNASAMTRAVRTDAIVLFIPLPPTFVLSSAMPHSHSRPGQKALDLPSNCPPQPDRSYRRSHSHSPMYRPGWAAMQAPSKIPLFRVPRTHSGRFQTNHGGIASDPLLSQDIRYFFQAPV